MIGAVVGDIVGFQFEGQDFKSKQFPLFTPQCAPTDDTFMTLAIAKALILYKRLCLSEEKLPALAVECMKEVANAHKATMWGVKFYKWLFERSVPYGSYGNGAAMRISPVGWVAKDEEELKRLCYAVTAVSHDHPEGLKGAEAMAMAVFLARTGLEKQAIKQRLARDYYPQLLEMTVDKIRPYYDRDDDGYFMSCQGSLPQALTAFFDSTDFEDAIRNAISLGGDFDTLGAMAGSVAEAYYGVPQPIEKEAFGYLSHDLKRICYAFETIKRPRVFREGVKK